MFDSDRPLHRTLSLVGPSGYEGNLGADADQENPTKPAKIQQICKFESDRFGCSRSEFRHGYKHIRVMHPTARDVYGEPIVIGVKLEVDPDQATTVRRIFDRYLSGHSLKRIALDLNDDGVVSPQPQKGRLSQTWCPSSVRHIFRNERYRGVVIWGKTVKVRSEKGTRIFRKKNESDWRRTVIPGQRIVSDKLFDAVRGRIAAVTKFYQLEGVQPGLLRARAATSQYIFSGLLKCALCDGSVTIVSGKSGTRQDVRYGCSMHSSRGGKVCPNSLLVARRALEEQLLAGLQQRVLHPDVVEYTLRRFEEELAKALRSKRSELDARRRHAQTIERKIANLTRALSDGYSPALTNELAQLERQLAEAAGRLADSEPTVIERRIRDTRRFVQSRLVDLQTLFGAEAVTIRARSPSTCRKSHLHLRDEPTSLPERGICLAWQHGWCRGPESNVRAHHPFPY